MTRSERKQICVNSLGLTLYILYIPIYPDPIYPIFPDSIFPMFVLIHHMKAKSAFKNAIRDCKNK